MYLFMHLFINAFKHCYFLHLLMFTYLYIDILSIAFLMHLFICVIYEFLCIHGTGNSLRSKHGNNVVQIKS